MNQVSAEDIQNAGLLVVKMAASGAQPIAVIVVGLDRKASELSAGTLWLVDTAKHSPEVREAIAACVKESLFDNLEAGK